MNSAATVGELIKLLEQHEQTLPLMGYFSDDTGAGIVTTRVSVKLYSVNGRNGLELLIK